MNRTAVKIAWIAAHTILLRTYGRPDPLRALLGTCSTKSHPGLTVSHADKPLTVKPGYENEEHGKSETLGDHKIVYFDETQRQKYTVAFDREGNISKESGMGVRSGLISTSYMTVVVGTDETIYAGLSPGSDSYKHSTYLAGGAITFAGNLMFERQKGVSKMKQVDNSTGHYGSTPGHMARGLRVFKKKGADLSETDVRVYPFQDVVKEVVVLKAEEFLLAEDHAPSVSVALEQIISKTSDPALKARMSKYFEKSGAWGYFAFRSSMEAYLENPAGPEFLNRKAELRKWIESAKSQKNFAAEMMTLVRTYRQDSAKHDFLLSLLKNPDQN